MGDLIFVSDASGKYLVLHFNYGLLNAKSIRPPSDEHHEFCRKKRTLHRVNIMF